MQDFKVIIDEVVDKINKQIKEAYDRGRRDASQSVSVFEGMILIGTKPSPCMQSDHPEFSHEFEEFWLNLSKQSKDKIRGKVILIKDVL